MCLRGENEAVSLHEHVSLRTERDPSARGVCSRPVQFSYLSACSCAMTVVLLKGASPNQSRYSPWMVLLKGRNPATENRPWNIP